MLCYIYIYIATICFEKNIGKLGLQPKKKNKKKTMAGLAKNKCIGTQPNYVSNSKMPKMHIALDYSELNIQDIDKHIRRALQQI